MYLTIPPSIWSSLPKLMAMNSEDVKARIGRRGQTEGLDYFEQLLPPDKLVPQEKSEMLHLQNVLGQLLLASWQPLSNQFYSLIFFLLSERDACNALVQEVRTTFRNYDEITRENTAKLEYLRACLSESFRLHQETVDGLPRVSPGAVVDGVYITPGVSLLSMAFTASIFENSL